MPARRRPFLEPKPIVLIVCEGRQTEPGYFHGLSASVKNPRVTIEIAPETGVPKTIVNFAKKHKKAADDAAKRERDDNLRYDTVWCVFDVDEHPHIPEARRMANDNGIDLAVSNPSFELWLLLHFRDGPGARQRWEVLAMLKKFVEGYDKHVRFADFAPGYPKAVKRARRLDDNAETDGEPGRNPTTGVYRLAEMVRSN
jgi:hypothetical protein